MDVDPKSSVFRVDPMLADFAEGFLEDRDTAMLPLDLLELHRCWGGRNGCADVGDTDLRMWVWRGPMWNLI